MKVVYTDDALKDIDDILNWPELARWQLPHDRTGRQPAYRACRFADRTMAAQRP